MPAVLPSSRSSPPRWARALDLTCLLLVVLAALIAMSGGFRVNTAGIRISLTSPYRVLIWAVALAAVRHVAAPRAPIYRDLPSRLAAAWRTPEARTAASAVIGTRPVILFAGYLAVLMIGFPDTGAPWRLTRNELGNLPVRWDLGWYLGIAIGGYEYRDLAADAQQNIVFFPAYPILMRMAGRLLGGSWLAYPWGGTAAAVLAFFGALVYLFRLSRDLLRDEDVAAQAVWFTAAYPFAVFFSAPYTESLYLLGATGAFFHFRRHEYIRAGAWGLIVGLTRPNGCFLAIPLALVAVAPWLPRWLAGGPPDPARPSEDRRPLAPAIAAAAMPGIGMLLYSAFIWRLTGDPLAWAKGHAAWGRAYQGLSVLVVERYNYLSHGVVQYVSELPGDVLNGLGALFVLAAAWPVARRLGIAYAAFILVNILPPLAAGGLLSAGRFSSVLFPAFVWFAAAVPAAHRPIWLAGFMALQAFNAALFYTWRPLY
jgi:hypothetical protein